VNEREVDYGYCQCRGRSNRAKDELHPEHTADESLPLLSGFAEGAQSDHRRRDETELHAVCKQQNDVGDGETAKFHEAERTDQNDTGDEIGAADQDLIEDCLSASTSDESRHAYGSTIH
jgi:hypothetical protein